MRRLCQNIHAYQQALRRAEVFGCSQRRPALLALGTVFSLSLLIFLAARLRIGALLALFLTTVTLVVLWGHGPVRRPRLLVLILVLLIYGSINVTREAQPFWRQVRFSHNPEMNEAKIEGEFEVLRCLSKNRREGRAVYLLRIRSVRDRRQFALIGSRILAYGPLSLQNLRRCAGSGRLEVLTGPRNLGGFSARAYGRGYGTVLSLRLRAEDIRALVTRPGAAIREAIDRFAERLSTGLSPHLSSRQIALFSALFLGDRQALTARDREILLLSSLSHLSSVSGYHLYVLLLPVSALFRQRPHLRRYEFLMSLVLLTPWLMMIGLRASLFRAFLLFVLKRFGNLLGARVDGLNTMAWLLVITLLYDPFLALNTGFLLSALASAAIVITAPRLQKQLMARCPWLGKGVSGQLGVSLAIQIYLFLPQFWLFSHLNLFSIPINVVAAVLVSLLFQLSLLYFFLTALLAMGVLGVLPEILLTSFARVFGWVIDSFYGWAELSAQIPAQIRGRSKWPMIVLVFCVLGAVRAWYLRPPFCPRFWRRILVSVLLGITVFSLCVSIYHMVLARRFRIDYLDVGQGNSVFIRHGGRSLLYDGGVPEQAGRVLWPYLRYLGINKIDLAIISHGHNDHIGGILELCHSQQVKQVLYPLREVNEPNSPYNADFWRRFQMLYPEGALWAGRKIRLFAEEGGGPEIEVLALRLERDFVESNKNDASIVLRFTYGGITFWLTGDATAAVEREIVTGDLERGREGEGAPRTLCCLQVAHHGSTSSSTPEFLAAYPPDLAIIPVGKNRYGHPREEVLSRLARTARILQTKDSGGISLQARRQGWLIHTLLPDERFFLPIP